MADIVVRMPAQLLVASVTAAVGQLPPAWRTWSSLFVLVLCSNRFSGTLPPEWADLPGLRVMDLGMNRLNGTLPVAWGKSASLEKVFLHDNQLSGTLPPSWGMQSVSVAWNNLTGQLPPSWAAVADLNLAGNKFLGLIPAVWEQQATLSALSINDNPNLQGCLPRAWRSRAEFRLATTWPNTLSVPYEQGAKEVRMGQVGYTGPSDAPGIHFSIIFGLFGLRGAATGPAVSTEFALQGTRLTGYC